MRMGYEILRADGTTRAIACPFCHNPNGTFRGKGTKCIHCGQPFVLDDLHQDNLEMLNRLRIEWMTEGRR
uniref:Uncharacterized protein n=1 Tax=viral metagenome TaxID=1070528 RepID=A0A6M3JBD0_9ZZZZ